MNISDGFGHESSVAISIDWITPDWVIKAFNDYNGGKYFFDLDPCASVTQPWKCAAEQFNINDNGLAKKWHGNIWLNPPYGPYTTRWVKKLIKHGNGIALIFARLETKLWQDYIFTTADGYLFPRRRIRFARPNGKYPKHDSGSPSAFIAWGDRNREALIELCDRSIIEGTYLDLAFHSHSFDNTKDAQIAFDELTKE